MALTVTSRGTGTHNTGATTLVPGGRTATLAVGSMGVFCIAVDNQGAAGAATLCPATWTDAKGNVWTRRQNALYDNGAASAGIEMAFYTAEILVALLTTDLGTITWDGGVSPVAKAFSWYEVIPAANAEVEYSTGGTIAGATAANAQVVTASVPVGDAVIAGYFAEGVAAVTQDADATNGAWTAQQTATIGATTSGVRIATQQKVQTTTPSTQSYDVTVASQDRIAGYIRLHEGRTAEASVVAAGGGVVAVTKTTNRNRAEVDTGGGVATVVKTSARSAAVVDTGGGVIAIVKTTNRPGVPVETGGGVVVATRTTNRLASPASTGAGVANIDAVAASVENHDVSVVVTGGGIVTASLATARSGAAVATGGGIAVANAATQRSVALAAAGGGVAVIGSAVARASSLAPTGAGVASPSITSARSAAALMSGGGVLSVAPSTQRAGSVVATGGGVAVVDGTSEVLPENHNASVVSTGGGAVAVAATSARSTSLAATGAGVATTSEASQRLAELLATGGGSAGVTSEGAHSAEPSATGGGVVVVGTGLPDFVFDEDVTFGVSLGAGDDASVSANGLVAGVTIDQLMTVEVET